MIHFQQVTLENCHTATGVVVVIDVLRAFTTAAYAFKAGAENIILTETVNEALTLRQRIPNALAMGEEHGLPVKGFDFNNSPSQLIEQNFRHNQLIQRTSAGTQGVVRSRRAGALFAASFVCAEATARAIQRLAPEHVTFVVTGVIYDRDGDEDRACADYLTARLRGEQPDSAPFIERIYNSDAGQIFVNSTHPEHPYADLQRCAEIDRFNFAMQVKQQNGCLVLEKVKVYP